MERLRSEVRPGKIIGIPTHDGGVTPGIVEKHQIFPFAEFGYNAEVLWVDTGTYGTAIYPDAVVQRPLPGLEKACYERIQLNSQEMVDKHMRGEALNKSLRLQRMKLKLK